MWGGLGEWGAKRAARYDPGWWGRGPLPGGRRAGRVGCALSTRTRTGVAKSKRKRQQRRGRSGGHPARRAPAPLRSSAAADLESVAELALVEARRRAEEALSPET